MEFRPELVPQRSQGYAAFVRSNPGSAKLIECVLQYSGFLAPVSH
jgi:hypothetical protein